MSVNIHDVLDYLDTHPVCRRVKDMGGLLEALNNVYTAYRCIDNEEIQNLFTQMESILACLSEREAETVLDQVCQLCWEHEHRAFSQGILAGMLLMTEINAVR